MKPDRLVYTKKRKHHRVQVFQPIFEQGDWKLFERLTGKVEVANPHIEGP